MSADNEFILSENTLLKLLKTKKESGFEEKTWDEWFLHVFSNEGEKSSNDKIIDDFFYNNDFEQWIKNFALNLNDIQNESSAKNIFHDDNKNDFAIVIGAGPSLKKNKHLEQLAKSNYCGTIICTDRSLIPTLKAGVTPERFPSFFVITIDAYEKITNYYDDEIVNKFGPLIKGIFSVLTSPNVMKRVRNAGIKIHWIHSLFDYDEGKKSFNHISALMIRSKKPDHKLPAIQTGGNVGTSGWFLAWKILKCKTICLIGMNHGWEEDDPQDLILSHGAAGDISQLSLDDESFQRMFPKIFNPYFQTYCILDPIFQYYSTTFKEFIIRSPEEVTTVNSTEGGSLFGDRITCIKFIEFLSKF
ncbi:hypothetical protein C6990_06380 [Nitrosopumilus sp. b3]|uniref:6-hydroxymethylpterin diphosphokinase MptE-like protein n=1 Tax=Nitrosopumilus sp. b3 TaxID=2109909 RepID=UPI0015F443B7|nr:6-hydroxymethylpterin diphosphokinase MptE-like protein [Nitrosopumilus sp. b3]KAF6246743.1 hypothetical protein C6990_06380 [Nitrosopumilus sp. b3]